MQKLALALSFLLITMNSIAQDKTVQELRKELDKAIKKEKDQKDTVPKTWKTGGMFNGTVGQTSLSNWAAGGDQFSFNSNGLLSLFAFYKKGIHNWDNTIDLELGYINSTSLGTRKTNDRIDVVSKYGCQLFDHMFLTGLFNFRSQFTNGYTYPDDTTKIKQSTFMAPAYVIVALGMDWKASTTFPMRWQPSAWAWQWVWNLPGSRRACPCSKTWQAARRYLRQRAAPLSRTAIMPALRVWLPRWKCWVNV
jgi:hypothetical protein